MKKYIFMALIGGFLVGTADAQFGDILEDVIPIKIKKTAGLAQWDLKSCDLWKSKSSDRVPSSSNVKQHFKYQHESGQWDVYVSCLKKKYTLKASSYEDADNLARLISNGDLKAGYRKGTFKGFFVSK